MIWRLWGQTPLGAIFDEIYFVLCKFRSEMRRSPYRGKPEISGSESFTRWLIYLGGGGAKGNKGHFRLGFRVPTSIGPISPWWDDEGGAGHFGLGFRVPITCDEKKFDDNR